MKIKKIIWIAAAVVLVGAAALYFGLPLLNQEAETAEVETPVQTSIARIGDLTILASATGEIIPASEIDVAFDTSGTIQEIYVTVGETVFVGDAIALLENAKSEASITSSIVTAQLNVIEAEEALEAVFSDWDMEAALALSAVEEAEQALEDLNDPALQQALALEAVVNAQDALDDAVSRSYTVNLTASQANIDTAYADLLITQRDLETAEEAYEDWANYPDTSINKAKAQVRVSNAQQAYDTAKANYNAMISTASEIEKELAAAELAVAEANLESAQADYEAALQGPSAGEKAIAEASLKEAQSEWERLKDGPDQAEITKAELKLEDAQAKLEIAEEDQPYIELTAPINGTVMEINGYVGENMGTQTFVILADLTQPLLEVYLDEADMDKAAVGYEVEVVFDAIPDELFSGTIIEVSPALETTNNFSAVKAVVQLNDFGKPQELPIGLSAAVDVIGGKAENAVLIPVEALREVSNGMYGVFVMVDGEPKLTPVEVGLVDYTSAEIISGVEVGDVVTTGIVETD